MFKLDFNIPPSDSKITLKDKIYLSGSCFSDEIGEKLTTYKFENLHNPFGTLYNPISIFKGVEGLFDSSNVIESQGVYYHWDCHGKISGLSQGEVQTHVEVVKQSSKGFLENATVLILTVGTSFAYEFMETKEIVSNCHKVPASKFAKRLLSKKEIMESFAELYSTLQPNLKIVFTVSPVRHIRDGLVENNLSKAILLEAVHEMVVRYENVQYFPSFEIMNDELRDYRFFAEDMIHPSQQAVDYIWGKFSNVFFDDKTKAFVKKWGSIVHALNHKAFQPKSKQHQVFLRKTLTMLEELSDQVDVSEELKAIENQIA